MTEQKTPPTVRSKNQPVDKNDHPVSENGLPSGYFVSMKIRSLVVEDEFKVRQVLVDLLRRFCPEIEVLAEASNIEEAEQLIALHQPQLIFLDIEMPGGNGFELLAKYKAPTFSTIFVTSYGHYAIRAIRFSALDYLLKPVMIDDLQQAVERAREKLGTRTEQYALLQENLEEKQQPKKLVLNNKSKLEYIETDAILYLAGDGNYTHIHLAGGRKHCLSRTLREFEEMLCAPGSPAGFVRIHKGCIVNLLHVDHLERGDKFSLLLRDGTKLEVSRRKKAELLDRLSLQG